MLKQIVKFLISFRINRIERKLRNHVAVCRKEHKYNYCTQDLENCDESQFCRKIGKPLFVQSFELTELLDKLLVNL